MFTSPSSRLQRKRFTSNTQVMLLDSIAGSFNGSTTTFNLSYQGTAVNPINPQNLFVVLGGILQQPGVAYTVLGSTITFASAPQTNEPCFIDLHAAIATNTGFPGSNQELIFNYNSGFSGDANLLWNSTAATLTVNGYINCFSLNANLANYDGQQNLILNGCFDWWQRWYGPIVCATSGATTNTLVVGSTISSNGYTADLWQVVPTGASVTALPNTTPRLLSTLAMQISGAASVTGITLQQRIESGEAARSSNQQMTFQAWIFNGNVGTTMTPQLSIAYPTASDNYTSTTTLLVNTNMQSCPNNAWTQVAYSFAANTTSQLGMQVDIRFPAVVASQYVKIAEVGLQVTPNAVNGIVTTPPTLAFRHYVDELNCCKRHVFLGGFGGVGGWVSATTASVGFAHPLLRVVAQFSLLQSSTPQILEPGVALRTGSASTISANNYGSTGSRLDIGGFSSATTNHPAIFESDVIIIGTEL